MKSIEMTVATVSLISQQLTDAERNVVSYDGELLTGPDAVIDRISALDMTALSRADLASYAASRRYSIEVGGITLNGASVATDRQTQQMVNGAFNMAQQNPDFTTMWKGPNGSFTQMDAATIVSIAQAIGAHVAACFAAEASVVAKINSGVITTREHVDADLVV